MSSIPSNNITAIGWMMAAMVILGIVDNLVRYIVDEISLWQFHTLRSIVALVTVALLGGVFGVNLRPKRLLAVLGRSLFLAIAMILYFGCLGFFPISAAAAGLFTAPVLVVFIEAIWSRKPIGPVRLVTALVGLCGALMVLKPDVGGLGWPNLVPILAGLFYATGNVATRKWCGGETPWVLTWSYMMWVLLIAGMVSMYLQVNPGEGFLGRVWVWPTVLSWWIIVVQAVVSVGAIACLMKAYLTGDAAIVSVFEYTLLIFASVTAYILFGTVVSPLGLLGMLVITCSGVVVAWRIKRAERLASVHVEAWQDNRSKLFAQGTGHFVMPELNDGVDAVARDRE
jgi:drug/metabolite transporter (DMT)-like permease